MDGSVSRGLLALLVMVMVLEPAGVRGSIPDNTNLTAALQAVTRSYARTSMNTMKMLEEARVFAAAVDGNIAGEPASSPEASDSAGPSLGMASMSYSSVPSKFLATTKFPAYPAARLGDPGVPSGLLSPLYPYQRATSTGCPQQYSVTLRGARGTGAVDDSPAIARTAAASAQVYFPLRSGATSSVYLIGSSITVARPIIVPCGVRLQVAAGKTLTITAQPRVTCMNQAIFSGSGAVKLSGAVRDIHPSWFGTPATDATAAVQRAADACASGACTVWLSRATGLTRTITLRGNAGVHASAGATVFPVGGSSANVKPFSAFTMAPGTYPNPISLSSITSFKYAVTVNGGVKSARVRIGSATYGTSALVLNPGSGSSISGLSLFLTACAYYTNCLEIVGSASGASLVNSVLRINFATTIYNAAVLFTGSRPPSFTRSGVVFQAVDPTPISPPFSTLKNAATSPASGFTLGVDTWLGGFPVGSSTLGALSTGQLVKGSFSNLLSSFALANADSMKSNNMWSMSGSSNIASVPYLGSAGAIYGMSMTASSVMSNVPVFYTSVQISSSWKAGTSQSFLIYTPLARWAPTSSFTFVPFRQYNIWLVCTKIENRNSITRNQLRVTLKNVSKSTIPYPMLMRFGLQVGF
ncbi:hypothetical protein ACKKBF_B01480 [Auxenochlorella protothecoides x Auxenochlorella symbiontica]